MSARAHIFVSGLVQGVYFRDFTLRQAAHLGITGWVRNTSDGGVELIAEGERQRIETLIEQLRIGPSSSRVDDIVVQWESFSASFDRFQITF